MPSAIDQGPGAGEAEAAQGAAGGDWADAAEARLVAAARALPPGRPFNEAFLAAAAAGAGLSAAETGLLLPGGADDLAALLFARHDAEALGALAALDPSRLKIRERIYEAVMARVEAAAADADLVRQVSLRLARPTRIRLGLELGWRSADLLWRWAGDRAADENHYSKRLILAGLLAGVVEARLALGRDAAERRLRTGIEAVMRFETLKAKLPRPEGALLALVGRLGAVRYSR